MKAWRSLVVLLLPIAVYCTHAWLVMAGLSERNTKLNKIVTVGEQQYQVCVFEVTPGLIQPAQVWRTSIQVNYLWILPLLALFWANDRVAAGVLLFWYAGQTYQVAMGQNLFWQDFPDWGTLLVVLVAWWIMKHAWPTVFKVVHRSWTRS